MAAAKGVKIVALDCRLIEPTPGGFERALANHRKRWGRQRTLLILDSYERFLLLDEWFRQAFIPDMEERFRIVVASRFPPSASWIFAHEWQGLIRVLTLRELNRSDSLLLLTRAGIPGHTAERLCQVAGGHPLALRLVAASRARTGQLETGPMRALLRQLAALYLEGVEDPVHRAAVEAAAVVHKTTRTLLQAMLPGSASETYDWLAESWLVEPTYEGVILNDSVREAVAENLRSSDPSRLHCYRQAAWRQFRTEAGSAGRGQMWAYTSGMIFLLQNPVVRDAFFPIDSQDVTVEAARPGDRDAIFEAVSAHETSAAARILKRWWTAAPGVFRVVRSHTGLASGFYLFLEMRDRSLPRMEEDPLIVAWRRHLRQNPIPSGQTAVFLRRWLGREAGELPSSVQAACWLDVKRSYMELRPRLRRCYLALCDLVTYGPIAKALGFQIAEGYSVDLDGVTHHLAVLDFGPGSVDAWISDLIAAELGVKPRSRLDPEARALIVNGQSLALTAMEFEFLRYLESRAGKAVARAELLEQVWRRRMDASSNVVDVLVRGLRRKMGSGAKLLTTVRGCGYSLRDEGR